MTKVFVSYSRKDKHFAERLNNALKEISLDSWIDWDDIPPTSDWWDQIEKGIESADAFLFLLSPDSVVSEVCQQEIEHAIMNGKRLIPLVVRDVPSTEVHRSLTKLNWIFFREQDDFATSLKKLEAGIRTDLAWVEFQSRLQVRAVEWEKRNDNSLLLRGKDLREAEEQLATAGQKDPQPTDLQRQYILESRRGASRIRNTVLVIAAIVMVGLALLSVFAFNQSNLAENNAQTAVANQNAAQTAQANALNEADRRATAQADAENQATTSRARELAAQAISQRDTNVPLSLLLAIEAYKTKSMVLTQRVLLDNIQIRPDWEGFLSNHQVSSSSVAWSEDGSLLAVGYSNDEVIIWDLNTNKQLKRITIPDLELSFNLVVSGNLTNMVFSHDNKKLFIASGNRLMTWEWLTEEALHQVDLDVDLYMMELAPDEKTVITWECGVCDSNTDPEYTQKRINVRNIETGNEEDALEAALMLNIDQTNLILSRSSPYEFVIWDPKTYRYIKTLPVVPLQDKVAISSDSKLLATIGDDAMVTLRSLDTHKVMASMAIGKEDRVFSLVPRLFFSPDNQYLAIGFCAKEEDASQLCDYSAIELWNTKTGELVTEHQFTRHSGWIYSLTFNPVKKGFSVTLQNGELLLLTLEDYSPIQTSLFGHANEIGQINFSPDGKIMATTSLGGTTILWDTRTGKPIGAPIKDSYGIAFSPDMKTMAVAINARSVNLLDIRTHETLIKFPVEEYVDNYNEIVFTELSFSPDGKTLFTIFRDFDFRKVAATWDVATGRIVIDPHADLSAPTIFSPNGKVMINFNTDEVVVTDTTGQQKISGHDFPLGSVQAFSPNNETLALLNNYTVTLWNYKSRQAEEISFSQIYAVENAPFGFDNVFFAPDGQTLILVNSHARPDISFWDINSHQLIGQISTARDSSVRAISLSPDGKTLAMGGCKEYGASQCILGETKLIALDHNSWISASCQRAGRNMTQEEWAIYFPGEEYRKTCELWSLEPAVIAPTP